MALNSSCRQQSYVQANTHNYHVGPNCRSLCVSYSVNCHSLTRRYARVEKQRNADEFSSDRRKKEDL